MSQTRILERIAISFSRGSSRPWSPALQADCLAPEPPGKFKASAYSLELVTELRRTFDILDYPSGRKSTTQEPPEGRGAEGPAPPHLAGGLSQLRLSRQCCFPTPLSRGSDSSVHPPSLPEKACSSGKTCPPPAHSLKTFTFLLLGTLGSRLLPLRYRTNDLIHRR